MALLAKIQFKQWCFGALAIGFVTFQKMTRTDCSLVRANQALQCREPYRVLVFSSRGVQYSICYATDQVSRVNTLLVGLTSSKGPGNRSGLASFAHHWTGVNPWTRLDDCLHFANIDN